MASDGRFIITSFISCFVIYYILSFLYNKKSQVPILIATFIFTNMVSRTSMFRSIVESAQQALNKKSLQGVPTTSGSNYEKFLKLTNVQQREILSAVESLKNYENASKLTNQRRRDLFKLMSSKQQKLCNQVGYSDKLNKIDSAITENFKFIDDVANHTIEKYGLSSKDFEQSEKSNKTKKSTTSSSNYRVIEALGHYTRDWKPENIGLELLPIYEYVALQLSELIPYESKKDTCLVFPGSGLGRLAHEFTGWGFNAIHSIEFSGLMNAFVDFNYSANSKSEYTIHPYIHTCSDFYSTESQLRTFEVKPISYQPKNLHLYQQDFRNFQIPNRDSYKNIVVVTAFFIDTAENLMDYLAKIQELVMPNGKVQRGYWINVGPLKYGSAAQVELNADELKLVRKNLGWKDYNSVYTIYDKLSLGNETGLVGYLTDKESMWQGYYGLNMFTSERKENKNK